MGTLVQSLTAGAYTGTPTFTLNVGANFNAANTVVVKASLFSAGSSSVNATCQIGGSAATVDRSTDVDGDGQRQLYIWRRFGASGSTAVQITLQTGGTDGFYEVSIEEWSGEWTPETGGTAKSSGSGTTSPSVSTGAATGGADRLLAALMATNNATSTTITTPSGFTNRLENETGSNNFITSHDWDDTNTAGTQTATWALSVARQFGAAIQAYQPAGDPPQIIRPSFDVSAGAWSPSSGVNLFPMIDEGPPPVDTDYIYTLDAGAVCTVGLQAATDPSVSTGHIVRYRLRGDGVSGLQVALLQDTTVITTWTHDPAPTDFTTYVQTLTGPQADSITNYAQLRLRFTEV